MIIESRTPLGRPEDNLLVFLGESENGYVYKTDSLSGVTEKNPEATITQVSSEKILEYRKVISAAVAITRETEEKIRKKYSLSQELSALRTGDQEYKAFIEQVVAEHNAAKDALFSL